MKGRERYAVILTGLALLACALASYAQKTTPASAGLTLRTSVSAMDAAVLFANRCNVLYAAARHFYG